MTRFFVKVTMRLAVDQDFKSVCMSNGSWDLTGRLVMGDLEVGRSRLVMHMIFILTNFTLM